MNLEICPDDLLLAARQGELSALDDAKLSFHLQRCARCRAALEVGRSFDAVLGARAGDDEIARSIAARMSERRPRRRFAFALAAGVLLTGSLAGAAASGVRVESLLSALERAPWASTRAGAPSKVSPVAPPQKAEETKALTPTPAPSPSEPVVAPAPEPAAPAPGPAAPSTSAPELFRHANELRGRGQVSEAQKQYKLLQAHFPGSVEARVSLVSLGRLELGSSPAAALRHFDAYLAQSAHRTLAEEALFGRASALGRLGRKAAERAAWQELLARFPASVYAQQAEARLSAAP